ncbi:hypothetical protein, partial [Streptomyces galilaeus]|uniref:hypothetical protein n=1 Tax=Streptomyces galilaeus TaxID=33899 RepID=UPI0038F6AA48
MSDVSPGKPEWPALEFRRGAGESYTHAAKYGAANIHFRAAGNPGKAAIFAGFCRIGSGLLICSLAPGC